eukprot:GILI01006898.1.p1 GENE.GILI01006898.1~~GILI01006898.1.p1  ORF type:complete len:324 (+),score=40.89 GILI01006898.1:51-1022(+)
MFRSRPANYRTEPDAAAESEFDQEARNEAARKCVRNLHHTDVLSADWLGIVEALEQLARLSTLETMLPSNESKSDVKGRSSHGTLWDQEANEDSIRILVEEAKVNLCLRMLQEYKAVTRSSASYDKVLEKAVSDLHLDRSLLQSRMMIFEESIGVLLKRAFEHIETVQLSDIPLLLNYISQVLTACLEEGCSSRGDVSKLQDTQVIYYLLSVLKHLEDIGEDSVMHNMIDLKLPDLLVTHISRHYLGFNTEILLACALCLAALVDSETYRTHPERFFVDENSKKKILEMKEQFVSNVLSQFPSETRRVRPLLDLFDKLKREGI